MAFFQILVPIPFMQNWNCSVYTDYLLCEGAPETTMALSNNVKMWISSSKAALMRKVHIKIKGGF